MTGNAAALQSKANPQQLEAILATDGPVLIIAGPGSGKTFTLVERIVYLITQKGVAPESLFVVTFTDKAARELTTRISNRLTELGIKFNLNEMYLGTFHSICLRLTVNFDPSAGLLTGLSIFGRATAYVSGQTPRQFATKCFVVDQKSLADEWVALEGLLSTLSDMVDQSEAFVRAAGKTPLTAQIAFWEKRQFEELCAAMGRHLPKVLNLANRKTKALAWLFPADELIEKPDGAVSPCVVFVDEIVRRVVFAPTPHVITLFDTAEAYYSGPGPIRQGDAFYREFLTNGIPRERIYEIWSNVTTIKRGSVTVPRNTVIQEFGNALEKQCRALNSVVEKLRTDFRGQLKANAPKLTLSIPQGARDVAFDSKLWVWWEELQYQTKKLESHQRLALDAEALEASYEAVRLTNGQPTGVPNEYIFDVLAGSTEATRHRPSYPSCPSALGGQHSSRNIRRGCNASCIGCCLRQGQAQPEQ